MQGNTSIFSRLLGGLAILLLAGTSHVQADPITTLDAAQDNIVGRNANTGSGDDVASLTEELRLRNNASFSRSKAYVKFDLSSTTYEPNTAATFTVTTIEEDAQVGRDIQLYGLNSGFTPGSGVLGTDWLETAITWNNAPGNDTSDPGSFTSAATFIGGIEWEAVATPVGTQFTYTISNISDFVQSDGTATFMLSVSSDSSTYVFASSRNTTYDGPQLSVVIPEPGSVLLIGLGSALLLVRRRTRMG